MNNTYRKNWLVAFFAATLIVAIVIGFVYIPRIGKTAVNINALPSDSFVTIEGKEGKNGTSYLSPGSYTFEAKKQGFTTATKKVVIGDAPVTVDLYPRASSDEAKNWLSNHPDEQAAIEATGAKEDTANNQRVQDTNSIVQYLPLGYGQERFAIDYGVSKKVKDGIVVQVTAEDPSGRKAALYKIREWGYDPSLLEIQFLDFKNPLSGGNN